MSLNNKTPVLMDVDTGLDDAIAMMLALESNVLNVRGICTTWGQHEVEMATANTLAICHLLGKDIPVYCGCKGPMSKNLTSDRRIESPQRTLWNDGLKLQRPHEIVEEFTPGTRATEAEHAVEFYIRFLTESQEPVVLIAVGPLTNLGYVFRLRPELREKVAKLIVIGGGMEITSARAGGESNFWHDPEAMQILLQNDLKPIIITLDVAYSVAFTEDDCVCLNETETRKTRIFTKWVREQITYSKADLGEKYAHAVMHDALAVASLIDPNIITDYEDVYAEMGLNNVCDGELLVDRKSSAPTANCRLACAADKGRFKTILLNALNKP